MSNNNDNNQIQTEINERKISKHSKLSEYEDPNVLLEHKKLKERVEKKRKEEKWRNKQNDYPNFKEKIGFKMRVKRWWFGMDKEIKRISWPSSKHLIISLLIVIFIVAVLTGIFFGINQLFIFIGILN